MLHFNRFRKYVLRDKAGDDDGGGGPPDPEPTPKPNPDPEPNDRDKEIAELKAKLAKYETKDKDDDDDDDLLVKTRKNREADDKNKNNTKALENALRFEMSSKEWLKQNKSLLPTDIEGIFETANKETYDSPLQKDADLKSGIVTAFFQVQSNLDLLTPSQKNQLDDYLKLTKNGKQDKAQAIYDNIFEPTFEMLKRVKKAEAVRGGLSDGSEDAYKQKLIDLSKKHYLGETK